MIHRGKEKLIDVHPDLARVAIMAGELTGARKFNISEGHRSRERQEQMVREGRSKTLNSKHCLYPAEAVDIYPISADGKRILWEKKSFDFITNAFKVAASNIGVKISCGTDWKFVDRPHIELA